MTWRRRRFENFRKGRHFAARANGEWRPAHLRRFGNLPGNRPSRARLQGSHPRVASCLQSPVPSLAGSRMHSTVGHAAHLCSWLAVRLALSRTRNADEADFFFVPAYSICMFEAGFFPMESLDAMYKQMLAGLPYFKRNRGRDHVFTFGSGLSANVFRSWRSEMPESIQLSPETWLFNDVVDMKEPCFNTWRDVAVPGYLHRHEILSLAQRAKPLEQRSRLAVFLGRIDSSRGPHPSQGGPDVRDAIRRLRDKGQIYVAQNLSFPEMHAVMGSAKFCFVPKGKSAWSLRFFEALFANCIPVILSDFWELPFESLVDVPSFVIKWPMELVGDVLMDYLESLSASTLQGYMDASKAWRCWYVYPPLLHEIPAESPDELHDVCPSLGEENAFEALWLCHRHSFAELCVVIMSMCAACRPSCASCRPRCGNPGR